MAFRERMIEGARGTLLISTRSGRKGTPIVFLHADGGDLHHWDIVRRKLDAGRPTVAFDRRGHGGSAAPRDQVYSHPDAALDVAALMEALQFRRVVLVGHSGGALTAFAFAALNPDKVTGLVLVDPPPDPATFPPEVMEQTLAALRSDAYVATLEDYYRSIAGGDQLTAGRVIEDALSTPRTTIIGAMEALRSFEPKRLAGRYRGPALSIIQPQYEIEGALHRLPPGFRHVALEGTGHWIHLDAPDRFVSCLNDFLKTEKL